MNLKRRDSSHHPKVIHHQETITGQPVQASAGEPTRSQKVPVNIKVRQAAREGIELVLHLEGAQVSQGNLFSHTVRVSVLQISFIYLSQLDQIQHTLPEVCPQKKCRLVCRNIATPGTSTVNC